MSWLRRKKRERQIDVAAELPAAVILVESWDETVPASTVLAGLAGSGGGVPPDSPMLLRCVLYLREDDAASIVDRLAGDGYVGAPARSSDPPAPEALRTVVVARNLAVTAQAVAQELAVLSSMTARSGGTFGGWAVLATLTE